jgi:RNA polymerase sigma-70 factor, ECF subfamily
MDGQARRLADGDPEAFAELYDECADRLHPYLVARLGSRADADDVLQETFAHLVRTMLSMPSLPFTTAWRVVNGPSRANAPSRWHRPVKCPARAFGSRAVS